MKVVDLVLSPERNRLRCLTHTIVRLYRVYKYWPWAPVMLALTRLPSPSSSTSVGMPSTYTERAAGSAEWAWGGSTRTVWGRRGGIR